MTRVLIDTSPDLRSQLLNQGTDSMDAVLYTHEHADHTHGIDDLRVLAVSLRRRVDVYFDPRTADVLRDRFSYCFVSPPGSIYPPILNGHLFDPPQPITINGPGGPIVAQPFWQEHGDIRSVGFRFGGLAYSSDLSAVPDDSLAYLGNLDAWIVDALRYTPHVSHFSVDDALEWIERIGPRRAILTNMHVDLDYDTLRRDLPEGVEPGYDGMTIDIDRD